MTTSWEQWCRWRGIDPDTKDESLFTAFLENCRPLPAPFTEQMAEWAAQNGVTPLSEASRTAFSRAAEPEDREAFYASWEAYDLVLTGLPRLQQIWQQRAEVLELERQHALVTSQTDEGGRTWPYFRE